MKKTGEILSRRESGFAIEHRVQNENPTKKGTYRHHYEYQKVEFADEDFELLEKIEQISKTVPDSTLSTVYECSEDEFKHLKELNWASLYHNARRENGRRYVYASFPYWMSDSQVHVYKLDDYGVFDELRELKSKPSAAFLECKNTIEKLLREEKILQEKLEKIRIAKMDIVFMLLGKEDLVSDECKEVIKEVNQKKIS